MNTPKSGKDAEERPHLDEKKRTNMEALGDEELRGSTAEEARYARGETRPDERYVDTTAPYRSDADRALGNAGNTVSTGLAGSLRGIDEVESELVNVVRNTLSNTLRATGSVGTEAVDVTRTTVSAAARGIGDIGTTAVTSVRDILLSIVGGIKDVASAALPQSYRAEDRLSPKDRLPPGNMLLPGNVTGRQNMLRLRKVTNRSNPVRIIQPSLRPQETSGRRMSVRPAVSPFCAIPHALFCS